MKFSKFLRDVRKLLREIRDSVRELAEVSERREARRESESIGSPIPMSMTEQDDLFRAGRKHLMEEEERGNAVPTSDDDGPADSQ